ncbi:hypothetical protein HDV00_007300 [Rhizophlyctis rosea]|nr:hypothetical protein HDV00_007300 [Rhizophlyctis rosea]
MFHIRRFARADALRRHLTSKLLPSPGSISILPTPLASSSSASTDPSSSGLKRIDSSSSLSALDSPIYPDDSPHIESDDTASDSEAITPDNSGETTPESGGGGDDPFVFPPELLMHLPQKQRDHFAKMLASGSASCAAKHYMAVIVKGEDADIGGGGEGTEEEGSGSGSGSGSGMGRGRRGKGGKGKKGNG